MDKSESTIVRAKTTYFFKETFRNHSKAEYREIFSRGLNDDNSGITGAFPWLYVRAFFALLVLFTINTIILRVTNNALFVPSVTFLGGITFTIPFIVLLYELYPKRDLSMFLLIGVLVFGGTLSIIITQIGYSLLTIKSEWLMAVYTGFLEEISKVIPAIIVIAYFKIKNPYACFVVAAAVGAGFSIIEDMGYIFCYSDKYVFDYHSDIQATIAMFIDRGMSSFCTHVLWTGAIGWAYSISKRPFRSVGLLMLATSIGLHICWDLPFDGWVKVVVISLCVLIAAVINIAIVHKSRTNILLAEVDLTRMNEVIILEAKEMGESMRFTNAANLTFALTCALLSVIFLVLCALPIGMDYQRVDFESKENFITYIEGDGAYNLKADWTRRIKDPTDHSNNVEELYVDNGEGKLILSHVVQCDTFDGFDGKYYYEYYVSDGSIYSISVELEDISSRIVCDEFKFDNEYIWAYNVHDGNLIDYTYNKSDGTVTAVINAEEFEGYDVLIGLIGTACAITISCTVIIVAFAIKLRRVKDEEQ